MATSSDKDDRSEIESPRNDPEARTDESKHEASEHDAEASADASQEAAAGRKEGDSTADPRDKGSSFTKTGTSSASARGPRSSAKRTGKSARSKAPAAAHVAPMRPKGGSLGKSMILFVIIVGGLAAAFAVLSRDDGGGRAAPNWKVGQQVDVELTLIKTDREDLACSSPDELTGRHCAYEAQTKRWSKGNPGDDKMLLKPYTTTNGAELLAAGLWSEPALQGTLPATRFSVKCKYTVEGKLKKPAIRWASDRPWYESGGDWYAGAVSGCTMTP